MAHSRTQLLATTGQKKAGAALDAATRHFWWLLRVENFDRFALQAFKSSLAGAATFDAYVTTYPWESMNQLIPSSGAAPASLDIRWVLETALVFASDPVAAAAWTPLPITASAWAWQLVLLHADVSDDIPADSLFVNQSGIAIDRG